MKAMYEYPTSKNSSVSGLYWIFTVASALVILIVFAVPILLDQAGIEGESGLTVSDVVDNPSQYAGQIIALEGEVENTIGSRGFTLDGQGVIGDEMLVVSRQPLQAVGGDGLEGGLFTTDDEVLISGTVRRFNRSEIENELGISLDSQVYTEYEHTYVFVADTVTKID